MARATASSDVFQAIAEPNRRQILDVLRKGDRSVGALVEATGLSYSLVSQHLKVLLDAHTVVRRAWGRQRIYRLDPAPLREVRDWASTSGSGGRDSRDCAGGSTLEAGR